MTVGSDAARSERREAAAAQARPGPGTGVDAILLGAILLLVAMGLVFVYSASAVQAGRAGDEFHFLKRQLLAAGVGLGLLLLAVRLGTERIARLAYPLMGVALVLLLLVPLVGKTAGGAQRWIPLGPLNLQPSELAKVALVLYLARSLARKQDKVRLFSIGLVPHVVVTAVVAGLCLWQKDLGTGFVLFLVLRAMLFAAGARVVYLLGAAAAALPVAYHLVRHTEYRWQRIVAFLDPARFKDTIGFQLWESLVLTSKGGWLGQGLGQGRARLYYLPAASTDFIAAVIAEEAGLLGVALLIGLLPHVLVTGLVAGLCLWQKDLGTGFVLFLVLLAMLFAAGARVVYLLGALAAALPVAYHLVRHTEYRWQRIIAFLDPARFKDTIGFQLWESLVLTSKGGWLGQGLGQGRARLYYLPAASTDFIAAVIAEEAGLLGVALLLGLFAVLVWRGLRATLHARDAFGCYAALGMTTLIGGQALVNLAVVLGMLPTKGLTLPFVSYGGSSLLTLLGGAGVLLAVSAERGGFLTRAPGAVRVAAPAAGVARLRAARAEEAR